MPLKAYRRPNGIYHIRGAFQGTRVDQSASTRDEHLAEQIKAELEQRILREAIYGRAAVMGFGEAALDYMDAGHTTRFLAPLIAHFQDTPLARIDQAALNAAARALYPGRSPATIRRQVFTPVKAVKSFAEGRRPQARPKERARTRWLTLEEADALITRAGRLAALLTFMIEAGPRTSEALRLDWADVDLDACRAFILQSKQGTARWAQFGPRTRAALASLARPGERAGPVFLTPKGRPYRVAADRPGHSGGNPIKRGFDAARAAARIVNGQGDIDTDVTPHVLRHTWASWAYAVSPDPYRIGEAGGWSDGQMPRRYVKLCPPGYGERILAAGWRPFGIAHAEAAANAAENAAETAAEAATGASEAARENAERKTNEAPR